MKFASSRHQSQWFDGNCILDWEPLKVAYLDVLSTVTPVPTPGGRGPIGGQDDQATLEHFATRFCNSVWRTYGLCLPLHDLNMERAAALSQILSHGKISVMDFPCGAGAGTLGLLASMAMLRSAGVVPTFPVMIHVTGRDISPLALNLFDQLLKRLQPSLLNCGIGVCSDLAVLDAFDYDCLTHDFTVWRNNLRSFGDGIFLVANFSGSFPLNNDQAIGALGGKLTFSVSSAITLIQEANPFMVWIEPPKYNRAVNFHQVIERLFSPSRRKIFRTDAPESVHCRFKGRVWDGDKVVDSGFFISRFGRMLE